MSVQSSVDPGRTDHCKWDSVRREEHDNLRARKIGEKEDLDTNALVGLAFSGGGIRSATFGLGILEALKQYGLLTKVHYLSTVSGGGYIGSWLSGNRNRRPTWLHADPPGQDSWRDSIAHLRRYSNYLSPRVGFFSADTWSMFTIWIRNALLIQATVILVIAIALLTPRPLFDLFIHWPTVGDWRWVTVVLFLMGVVGIAGNQLALNRPSIWLLKPRHWGITLASTAGSGILVAAAWVMGQAFDFDPFTNGRVDYRLAFPIAVLIVLAAFLLQPLGVTLVHWVWQRFLKLPPPERLNYTQSWAQTAVVLPMMATGYLVAAILRGLSQTEALASVDSFGAFFTKAWLYWPFPLAVVFASLWLLSACSVRDWKNWWTSLFVSLLAPIPAVLVLHALLSAIMLLLHDLLREAAYAFVWGPSLVLYAFSLTVIVLIGMMSREATEGSREWWSRLGAWLSIYGFCWMVIAVAAVYGPLGLEWLVHSKWKISTATLGWIGTTVAGLFAGNSDSTNGKSPKGSRSQRLDIVAKLAPFVFIAGLLVAIAAALDHIVMINSGASWVPFDLSHSHGPEGFLGVSLIVLAGCAVALLLMAWRVDINEFSLNAFYRNRLVRCYLGATRTATARKPQNFTGFDDDDDIPLTELTAGPLHIVNCALNLGGSSDLALHTRQSTIFTLTPVHCGSNYVSKTTAGVPEAEIGYVRTMHYGAVTLGQAVSVSGAAASPNMGYHTSPVVAFLLTLFNVRLGWWFRNPRDPISAKVAASKGSSSPHINLPYLFAELFGGATDRSTFLNISDGGHFENLAAYELVKRECRVIVVCDGECDPELKFEGLGTLIRMCEVDFKARIKIDVGAIRSSADSSWSANRCAVGTIEYETGRKGTLIYLKASMTGHEPTDVLQYKAAHPPFPHESTGDQFYSEDQFESYRHLGYDIACRLLEPVMKAFKGDFKEDVVALANRLEDISAPTRAL